jgi:ATP dependent DNA ligase domain
VSHRAFSSPFPRGADHQFLLWPSFIEALAAGNLDSAQWDALPRGYRAASSLTWRCILDEVHAQADRSGMGLYWIDPRPLSHPRGHRPSCYVPGVIARPPACMVGSRGLHQPAGSPYLRGMLSGRIRTDGFIDPCIPSCAPKPPSGPGWVHEIKHDGYRLIVRRDGKTVRLFTRRGHDWTERYPAVAAVAAKLRAKSFTLDGEAVVPAPTA